MGYPSISTVFLTMSCSRLGVLTHVGALPAPQTSPVQGSSPKIFLRQDLSNFDDNNQPLTLSLTELNTRPTPHPRHRRVCLGSFGGQRSQLHFPTRKYRGFVNKRGV
ncbi:hypothetical protein BC834DRAFT_697635 [Gloeopeniophorella convolvens]|nr:hypothetical protein BC834DRAFT_697635 [Gloeopeniophorella convolvens]